MEKSAVRFITTHARTTEQAAAVRAQLDALEKLAAPLVAWIREHHDPHTEVSISWDYVRVKHDGLGVPFPYSES